MVYDALTRLGRRRRLLRPAQTTGAAWAGGCAACSRLWFLGTLALAACAQVVPPPTTTALPEPTPTANIVVALQVATPGPAATLASAAFPQEVGPGAYLSASGSYTQTETEAAGPMICQIKRDSYAFRLLAVDTNPAILFSQGEPAPYGAEDRLMHPDLVPPLDRLAGLVAAEWGDAVQLMVTEAYDSLLEHDITQPNKSLRYSLHFEGRSLDLITWPPDTARNGRVCALALQAGFSWVHNEVSHCHVSLKTYSLCTALSSTSP